MTLPTGDTSVGSVDGGTLVDVAAWLDEDPRELQTKTGAGLDARWVLDLTQLQEEGLDTTQDRLFVRTEAPLGLTGRIDAGWSIRLAGLVDAEADVDIDALRSKSVDMGVMHLECSGNSDFGGFGLQGAVRWSGVPLADVLAQVTPAKGATRIRISGFDEHPPPTGNSVPGAAWVFRPEDLTEAFLATHAGGELLSPDHGAPVRLFVPGWYGCTCIKWVEEIAWVDDDEPATSQMQEFASRTMQPGVPALARDYIPAVTDVAATPIRVETWEVAGERQIRVVGIVWGGSRLPDGLRLWADDVDVGLVEQLPRGSHRTWGLWTHELPEEVSGRTEFHLTVDDADLQTRRLDSRYYARTARVRR